MPDSRRPYRRLTDTRLITRALAHLVVLGLVVSASAFGIAHARSEAKGGDPELFSLISAARGAANESAPSGSSVHTLLPQPDAARDVPTSRGSHPRPVAEPQAQVEVILPTPLPVDPNATPLPGPPAPVYGTGATDRTRYTTLAPAAGAASGGALAWPVPGGSISQYFHAGHLALDVAGPYGSRVNAAGAGTVTYAGWKNNGGGLVVTIDHGNGIVTVYNHLGSVWVTPGQAVARGAGIAGVGCTGMCTGPHVHFEVIVNGVITNPLRYL